MRQTIRVAFCTLLLLSAIHGEYNPVPAPEHPAPYPVERSQLEVPTALWDMLLEGSDIQWPPGVAGETLLRRAGCRHVLPSLVTLFDDMTFVPVVGGRMGDLLLQRPGDFVQAVHLAYRLLGASAGYGPPLPGADSGGGSKPRSPRERVIARLLSPAALPAEWESLPLPVRRLVADLLEAAATSAALLPDALALDPLAARTHHTDNEPWVDNRQPLAAPHLRRLSRVDLPRLSYASRLFAENLRDALAGYRRSVIPPQPFPPVRLSTTLGEVGIFGTGNDRISLGLDIIIDLGGDDTYADLPDTSPDRLAPVRLVLDLDGNDVYDSTAPASLACGHSGIGVLLDLAGDDRYACADSGLGSALYGTGLLVDYAGNDVYDGRGRWTSGAARVGAGILLDLAGDDRYYCAGQGQGFGSTLGVGLLLDAGGADEYYAHPRPRTDEGPSPRLHAFTQGSAQGRWAAATDGQSLGGGYGFLVDGAGDDRYIGGNFCQGAGYWWGGGFLEDRSGNDVYRNTSYALGAAAHHGLGCAVDLTGDDAYNVDNETGLRAQNQGHARDGSVAVFMDGAGTDRYLFRNRCAGVADELSAALFWDRCGDDAYTYRRDGPFDQDGSCGFALDIPPGAPLRELELLRPGRHPVAGLFLDSGGGDTYQEIPSPGPAPAAAPLNFGNDRLWRQRVVRRLLGLGLDMAWYSIVPAAPERSPSLEERF